MHSNNLLGYIGAGLTALLDATKGPSWLTYFVGIPTGIYWLLKISFMLYDRWKNKKD